jgi:hypothetical protein
MKRHWANRIEPLIEPLRPGDEPRMTITIELPPVERKVYPGEVEFEMDISKEEFERMKELWKGTK